MKKNFLFILTFIILFFVFGCQEPAEKEEEESDVPVITGEWLSPYDETFIIAVNETPAKFYCKYGGVTTYAGEIIEHDDYSDKNGYITIKYTENAFSPDAVNRFYRIHWKNFTTNNCKISGAYRSDLSGSDQYSAVSLEEAKVNFTIENGAFAGYSDCVKQ